VWTNKLEGFSLAKLYSLSSFVRSVMSLRDTPWPFFHVFDMASKSSQKQADSLFVSGEETKSFKTFEPGGH
jgi:hypothetical protein